MAKTAVLHVTASDDRRGAEVFATQLAATLGGPWSGGRVMALAPGHTSERLNIDSLGPSRRHPSTFRNLRRMARDVNVIVAHGSTTLPVCAVSLVGTGTPFVYRNIGDPDHWGTTRARRLRSHLFLDRAAKVVSLTSTTADRIAERYRIDRDRIVAIPKGVPSDLFPLVDKTARDRARQQLDIAGDVPLVLYLGALGPEKRVDLAIEAVSGLDGVELLIVGDGAERDALERLAAARAPDRIRLTGPTSEPQVALAAADVLVSASDTEGLPGVLIEAGLMGIPVVATDVGFVRDIVSDESGRIVPPGDVDKLRAGIAEVLAASPGTFSASAREHCDQHFGLHHVAAAWADVLDTVSALNDRSGITMRTAMPTGSNEQEESE